MLGLSEQLRESLDLSVGAKAGQRRSAVAISASGNNYFGARFNSPTKLLNIDAEQAALMLAVQRGDFGVTHVATMQEDLNYHTPELPTTAMLLIDHMRRTGRAITYTVLDIDGVVVSSGLAADLAPYYAPAPDLSHGVSLQPAAISAEFSIDPEIIKNPLKLREFALAGMKRAFTAGAGRSRYGAAAVTTEGKVFISGQYSGYDGRTIHAEMGAVVNAALNGGRDITHLGVVSEKFPESPTDMCGCCRQFIGEYSEETGCDPQIFTFSAASDIFERHTIDTYLPSRWSLR